MADLITTIKVNSSQFDNSIKESTNQIRKFKSEGDKASGSVNDFGSKLGSVALGGVSKIAGALGVAFTAMEAFNGIIQSTNSTADTFERVTMQAKTAVDYFFTSIATGDWSNFFDGLLDATDKAREFKELLDKLDDKKEARRYFEPKEKLTFNKNRNIINDRNSSKEARQSAITENEELIQIWTNRANKELELNKNLIITEVEKVIGRVRKTNSFLSSNTELKGESDNITDVITDMIFEYKENSDEFYVSDQSNTKHYISDYIAEKERRKKEIEDLDYSTDSMGRPKNNPQNKKQFEKLNREYNNWLKSDEVFDVFEDLIELENLFTEGLVESIIAKNDEAYANLDKIEGYKGTNLRLESRVQGSNGRSNDEEVFPEGSIADLEKRIADLNKQIKLETDPVAYKALQEEIESLQRKIVYIKVMYTTDFDHNEKISNSIKPLNAQNNKYIKDGKINVKDIPITVPDLAENLGWVDIYNNALDTVRDKNEGMLESFDSISNALSAIGNASDGSAAAMFRWVAATISSIGQAIPIIEALTLTKKAEANANTEAAASGAAASVAGIPVVGALLAVGAVATVLASLASIPKFADGGIVYGNTIAQVGEYAGASNNPEVIAPLSKLRKILAEDSVGGSGSVDFRIAGKDLVGVINNYSSKNKKK